MGLILTWIVQSDGVAVTSSSLTIIAVVNGAESSVPKLGSVDVHDSFSKAPSSGSREVRVAARESLMRTEWLR